nr:ribose-phosphate diphosphokinase [Microbulbifer sediminum]
MLFALEQPLPLVDPLLVQLAAQRADVVRHRFPDGETYLRVETPPRDRDCVILANFCDPDPGYLALVYLAATLRDLGAASVGLVAPYLCYMRQDCRFRDGEAVTSRIFASELSRTVDWLVTVDPHLHRYQSLGEIYSIPALALSATGTIGNWVRQQETAFLLVGPDSESRQWVAALARDTGLPFIVGEKVRSSDSAVSVQIPDIGEFGDRTALIVDDVISTGHTLMETAAELRRAGLEPVDCAAVHGIFAGNCERELREAGIRRIYTSNSIPGPHCAFDLAPLLAESVRKLLSDPAKPAGNRRTGQ